MVELSQDDAYQGKTFGVISLLSSSKQDVYLQHQLLARLGEREFALRELKVGGAYAFQGAERDVMFVSLVVDSIKRFGSFTSLDDERRVNVTASRARDQVWIFHSAQLQEFGKNDIRRAWLEYASSGFSAQQQYDNLEDLCESNFERDVLRAWSSTATARSRSSRSASTGSTSSSRSKTAPGSPSSVTATSTTRTSMPTPPAGPS